MRQAAGGLGCRLGAPTPGSVDTETSRIFCVPPPCRPLWLHERVSCAPLSEMPGPRRGWLLYAETSMAPLRRKVTRIPTLRRPTDSVAALLMCSTAHTSHRGVRFTSVCAEVSGKSCRRSCKIPLRMLSCCPYSLTTLTMTWCPKNRMAEDDPIDSLAQTLGSIRSRAH